MKKIFLLGLLLLSTGVVVTAEELQPIIKWSEMELQTMNFDNMVIIKDRRILRKGNYKNGKFFEKSKEEIISADNKKICTKKECIYINENNMPILKLESGKEEKGTWSFGTAKLKLQRSMKTYDK